MPEGGDHEHVELVEVGPLVDAHLQPLLRPLVPRACGRRHAAAGLKRPDIDVADARPLRDAVLGLLAEAVQNAETLAQLPQAEVAAAHRQEGQVEAQHASHEAALGEGGRQQEVGGQVQRADDEEREEEASLCQVHKHGAPARRRELTGGVADVVHDVVVLAIVRVGAAEESGEVVDEAKVVEQRGEGGHVLGLTTAIDATPAVGSLHALVDSLLGVRRVEETDAIHRSVVDGPREHLEATDQHHLVGRAVERVAHVIGEHRVERATWERRSGST